MGKRSAIGESVIDYNRSCVIHNQYQGKALRVLCACSGGVLRSPTAAWVLSNAPYNYNTRSAGTEDYALIKVDEALLQWAQVIVCMTADHEAKIRAQYTGKKPLITLNIPDNFKYRDPELIRLINEAYAAQSKT